MLVDPAAVADVRDVDRVAVEVDAVALHRDPARRVEPVDPVLSGQAGRRDLPAAEPRLRHGVVLGDNDAAQPPGLADGRVRRPRERRADEHDHECGNRLPHLDPVPIRRAGASGLRQLACRTHGSGNPLGDAFAGVSDLLVQQGRLAVGHVAVGQPDAQDARQRAPLSFSVSQTAEPKPPDSTPSSTVTSSSCSAASWAASPASIGLAKRASATVASMPRAASRSAASSALSDAAAVAEDGDARARALAQDLAGADRDRASAAAATRRRSPRRAGSAGRRARRRSAARCAAGARAGPRRAGPSARCWAGSAGRRCRRRRGGSARRRRPARRGPWRRPR